MNIEIITGKRRLEICGFGGMAINKDYVGTAFRLSGRMWEVVKANELKNKGKNIWVYEANDSVFTGVELETSADCSKYGLETKLIDLEKYAYYKHIGPYQLIKQAGREMTGELNRRGLKTIPPYIEIYGHWTGDESKSETELIMCLE
jgi:effector-binding domain-containing protein